MEQLEKRRRPRKSKREKLEEELVKIGESIEQYQAAIVTMEERRQAIIEEIEQEEAREVTKFLKENKLSLEQLKALLGEEEAGGELRQGA